MKRFLAMLLLAGAGAIACAAPSVEAVQAEVGAGRYEHAEAMMREVVADHPDSARAHYVHAEVLAHLGRYDDAQAEARKARELDPQLRFTTPERFRSFEAELARATAAGAPARRAAPTAGAGALTPPAMPAAPAAAAPAHERGLPLWVWVVGAIVVLALVASLRRRRQAAAPYGAMPGAGVPGTNWPGGPVAPGPAGYPTAAPGSGPGWLGAGMAAAGGVAAGMMAERLLEGHRDATLHDAGPAAAADHGGAIPGLQPGMFDDYGDADARRALQDRPVDFGSGSDDWSDGGGGADLGGSDGGASSDGW